MAKVIVYHASAGCDTGCCGHVIAIDGEDHGFHFAHPYDGDFRQFAENLVRDCGCDPADLDWDNCVVRED